MSSKWKGIPEGQKGKGHEGYCTQTRISPQLHVSWGTRLKQSDTIADHYMKNVDLGIFLKCEWAVQHAKG